MPVVSGCWWVGGIVDMNNSIPSETQFRSAVVMSHIMSIITSLILADLQTHRDLNVHRLG